MIANRDQRREALERNAFYKSLEEANEVPQEAPDNYDNYFENQRRINNMNNIKHEYAKFLDSIDKVLMSEACIKLFEGCRGYQYTINKESVEKGKQMIRSYFNECNIFDLERSMRDKNTLFLTNLMEAVDYSHKKILETVDKDNEKTFTISQDQIDDFYNHLDKESFDDATEMIRNRVAAATQDFVVDNKADKAHLTQLMNDTKANIDAISSDTQEEAAGIVKEMNAEYKRKANAIRDRKKSMLEQMIYSNYENIMKDTVLTESFSDNEKIDIDAIVEFTEIQYTVLEMLNTLKIDEMTEEKVKELLG